METISAREANQAFLRLVGDAEGGEEIATPSHGRPAAAVLSAPGPAAVTPEGQAAAAVERALALPDDARWLGAARRFTREEKHER